MRRLLFGILVLVGLVAFYEFVLVAPSDQATRHPAPGTRNPVRVDNSDKMQENGGIVKGQLKSFDLDGILESIKSGFGLDGTAEKEAEPQNQATGPPPDGPGTGNQLTNPDTEKIKEYLIASSDIGFSQNTVELQLALHLAEDGDFAKLIEIIRDFERKYAEFQKLTPPVQASDIHQKSLDLMGRFMQLLRDARNEKRGSVEQTWNSPERAALVSQSQEVVSKIRALVGQYNISLPPEVLP